MISLIDIARNRPGHSPARPAAGAASRRATALLLAAVCLLGARIRAADAPAPAEPTQKPDPITPTWRGAWCATTDPKIIVPAVTKLRFDAVIAHANPARMRALAQSCREAGLECYYWLSLDARGKKEQPLAQVLSPADEEVLKNMAKDPDPHKHGYQFGGEPLPGHRDVLVQRLLCFHRPETAALIQAKIRHILTAVPELTGIALDYFGYQNLHCCYCETSKKRLADWRQEHPDVPENEALERFSLDSLVDFINRTADAVRTIKPGAKTVIHVYPAFQPQPLYGARLKVDYCCETAAWFFKPYWSDEKIARYTRTITARKGRAWPHSRGIPFVGLFVGRSSADKSAERFAHELTLVFRNCPSRSLSIYQFDKLLKHAEHRQALEVVLDTVWPK